MARAATGQVVARKGNNGTSYGLRFRAYGERRYITAAATNAVDAEAELRHILADVERGIWKPHAKAPVEAPVETPTFHDYADRWLIQKEALGLKPRTVEMYTWQLECHLLPFFHKLRLDEITRQHIRGYAAEKRQEGKLGNNAILATLTRLGQILADAVDEEIIERNVAAGRKPLKRTKPRRTMVQPEQLMILLKASEPLLYKRGRPLLAVLAGAGLRIQEALDLRWSSVNLARGTITVEASKTDAGVRVVDLSPALREELVEWRARARYSADTDLVFPTHKANPKLLEAKVEPIGSVTLHGLRRLFCSLRTVAGEDPVYVADQMGHTDPSFTLRTYAQAVKHRQRLTSAEKKQYDAGLQWARLGTNAADEADDPRAAEEREHEKSPVSGASSEWALLGSNQ